MRSSSYGLFHEKLMSCCHKTTTKELLQPSLSGRGHVFPQFPGTSVDKQNVFPRLSDNLPLTSALAHVDFVRKDCAKRQKIKVDNHSSLHSLDCRPRGMFDHGGVVIACARDVVAKTRRSTQSAACKYSSSPIFVSPVHSVQTPLNPRFTAVPLSTLPSFHLIQDAPLVRMARSHAQHVQEAIPQARIAPPIPIPHASEGR